MEYFVPKKRMLWLVSFILVLLAGCSRGAEPTPKVTRTPTPAPFDVTFCDIDPSDVCLEGFGLEDDERLLVLFKTDNPLFVDIYIRADGPDGEMLFECRPSDEFSENVYCLGEPFPEGELIKLYIHSNDNDRLVAIGVFNVQYSALQEPDIAFGVDATLTPASAAEPSYPNPSYPDPSYPNPTP